MENISFAEMLTGYGPLGITAGYFIWKDIQNAKNSKEMYSQAMEQFTRALDKIEDTLSEVKECVSILKDKVA